MSATAAVAAEISGRNRGTCHAVASQPVQVGYVTCEPGEALCGTPGALQPCLGDLFGPPPVTCHLCAAITARLRIAAGDGGTR